MTDSLEDTAASLAKSVLVTGANGFVGTRLCAEMRRRGFPVRAALRQAEATVYGIDTVEVGSLGEDTDWTQALRAVDTVVHLAARVHVMRDIATDPLAEFRKVNVDATLNLARQAAAAEVKRFVFISSVKVNGEETPLGQPYTAEQAPAPIDPYGISKLEAEEALRRLSEQSGMDVVVIRPPLVYGPGVKGNFHNMMRWLLKGIPLPLASARNRRSLVALDNLVDLIITCIRHPAAANQTFLVSDGDDLSTPDLLRRTASALAKRSWLLPVPVWLLQLGAGLLGKRSAVQKLCGSLQVNIDKTRERLGWMPPLSVDEALRLTAEDFLRRRR